MRFGSSHLRFVPVVLRGRPGTSACSSTGESTTSKPGRPRMSSYCSCVLEIRPCADEADEGSHSRSTTRSWPQDAVSTRRRASGKRFTVATTRPAGDFLDGEPAGSVVWPRWPRTTRNGAGRVLTVLPEQAPPGRRDRALYAEIVGLGARNMGRRSPRPNPRARATRRSSPSSGAASGSPQREPSIYLELADVEPPQIDPPEGIEIVALGRTPRARPGMHEVDLRGISGCPGSRGLERRALRGCGSRAMQGRDLPKATFHGRRGHRSGGLRRSSSSPSGPEIAVHMT